MRKKLYFHIVMTNVRLQYTISEQLYPMDLSGYIGRVNFFQQCTQNIYIFIYFYFRPFLLTPLRSTVTLIYSILPLFGRLEYDDSGLLLLTFIPFSIFRFLCHNYFFQNGAMDKRK